MDVPVNSVMALFVGLRGGPCSRVGGDPSGLRPRGVSVLVVLYRPHQRLHAQEAGRVAGPFAGRVAGPFAHRVDLGRCSLYALLSSSANGDNDSTHLTGFS